MAAAADTSAGCPGGGRLAGADRKGTAGRPGRTDVRKGDRDAGPSGQCPAGREPGGRTGGAGPHDHRGAEGAGGTDDLQFRLSVRRTLHGGDEGDRDAERGGGYHRLQRVLPGPGRGPVRLRGAVSPPAVSRGRQTGGQRGPGPDRYLRLYPAGLSAADLSGLFAVPGVGGGMCGHSGGDSVAHQRADP